MSNEYRAAYFGMTVLTAPEDAHLSDAQLKEKALEEAIRADIIDMVETDSSAAYPRVTRADFDDRLAIGLWSA